MTPTWVTFAVALVAGLASGLLGTMLRITHDRDTEIRTRMIDAADEFTLAAVTARQKMRTIAGLILSEKPTMPIVDGTIGWYTEDFLELTNPANDAIDDVLAKQQRVHLLFGDLSPAGVAATAIEHHLRLMYSAIQDRPSSLRDHDVFAEYSRNFTRVQEETENFNRAALAALQNTTPKRFGRWLAAGPRRVWG